MPSQMQEAMHKALSSKTIKFNESSEEKPMVEHSFPPTFTLSTKQLSVLGSKGIGDECEFEVKAKIVGIDKSKDSQNYRFEVEEMKYEPNGKEEPKEPMQKAYKQATSKDEYVKLRTEPYTG